jgi:NAD(P)-dependent dehydrogenase (short-subunit alcohol dehydrogenase family)
MRLKGKNAIVTGAVGNIGLAVTRLFLKEGARVFMVDRDAERLGAVAAELNTKAAETFVADVTEPDEVGAYAAAAEERFGPVHVFFNNAGIEGPIKHVADYPLDGFEQVMAVNTTGVFLGMKYVLPKMPEWGSVIITSSIMGVRGTPRAIGYSASKHAVVGIMRSAARDAAKRRIRVNTVHPGFVDSDMLRRIEGEMQAFGFNDPEQFYLSSIPFGMKVTPHEIAQTVLFLASDESRQITGQTIAIDGGHLL